MVIPQSLLFVFVYMPPFTMFDFGMAVSSVSNTPLFWRRRGAVRLVLMCQMPKYMWV